MFFSRKYKNTLLKIERIAVRVHRKVEQIEFRETKIQEQLARIMSQQEELDTRVAAANAKLDAIGESLGAVPAAIQAETQQIQDFIASHTGSTLDLAGLDGVVGRLNSVAESVAGLGAEIGGVFEPPADSGAPA
jgi:uncharacterized protein involved in exopolysaccharide biosynthesis